MPDTITTTVVGSETTVVPGGQVDLVQTFVFLGGATAPGAVPNGGLTGQSLTKRSNADGDFGWDTPSPIDGGTFN